MFPGPSFSPLAPCLSEGCHGTVIDISEPLKQKARGDRTTGTQAAHSALITLVTNSEIHGDSPIKTRTGKKYLAVLVQN